MITEQTSAFQEQSANEWNETLAIEKIVINRGTQPRVAIDTSLIDEYAEDLKDGARFPPLDVVFDGEQHFLWDGFHRLRAAELAGRAEVEVRVRRGTLRDAVLMCAGANTSHGLRRSNVDKRRAAKLLLEDPEWSTWSNVEIARRAAVSEHLVRTVRADLTSTWAKMETGEVIHAERSVARGGTTYVMAVDRIGRGGSSSSDSPSSIKAPVGSAEEVDVSGSDACETVPIAVPGDCMEGPLRPESSGLPSCEVWVEATIPFVVTVQVAEASSLEDAIEQAKKQLWEQEGILAAVNDWQLLSETTRAIVSSLRDEERLGRIHYEATYRASEP